MGNYVYNVNNNNVYLSVMGGEGSSYVIQTYSTTTPQSFFFTSLVAETSPLPFNVIDGITFYCRYITYMRFYNVNYLLSSVIASNSQIQIFNNSSGANFTASECSDLLQSCSPTLTFGTDPYYDQKVMKQRPVAKIHSPLLQFGPKKCNRKN